MSGKSMGISALSISVVDRHILALVKTESVLSLLLLNEKFEVEGKLAGWQASKGFILHASENTFLLSVDNKLVLFRNGVEKIVLKLTNSGNFFWHATKVNERLFVHEYGEAPTGIYSSSNLEDWERLTVNTDIDKSSRHFHYIVYDPYRNWLIATLGDGCLTRVAVSKDLGNTWEPLYKGPWQFVPAVPLKDRIVFGMDGGIAKGGVGIYYPYEDRWEFIFLKWLDESVKFMQMRDLKLLDNSVWVATLGTPQAIIVSKDLRTWYPLYVESIEENYNYYMNLNIGMDFIVCPTGRSLLFFREAEIENVIRRAKPIATSYKAYINRLIGVGFIVKSKLLS